MKEKYFVKTLAPEELQINLNAFVEQGYIIRNLFEYKDQHCLPMIVVVAEKPVHLNAEKAEKIMEEVMVGCIHCGKSTPNDPKSCPSALLERRI